MTTTSFYQRFPNEAPALNLAVFDRLGYTHTEDTHRNETTYEAENCEVSSTDGCAVLSADVRVRPRGGEIEAFPRLCLQIYREGKPFVVRKVTVRAGRMCYTMTPDAVQTYSLRGDSDGGFLEVLALPMGKIGMQMLWNAAETPEETIIRVLGAQSAYDLPLGVMHKAAIRQFCLDCERAEVVYQPAFLCYRDYCTKE